MVAPLAERFWSHVNKTETCWLWQGARYHHGYGRFQIGASRFIAHRMAYELTYGLILPGILCCHHCDVRLCVRPDHLFLGTHADNGQDMSRKGRSGAHVHPETLARGAKNGMALHRAKLTECQVQTIRHLHAAKQQTYKQLAASFSVSVSTIEKIVCRERWRHIP